MFYAFAFCISGLFKGSGKEKLTWPMAEGGVGV